MDGFVARLRGLPWSTTADDIVKFFHDCQIAQNDKGVHLTISREGRASGEAFVEFASEEDVEKAIEKNNEHLGSRYIEVFRSKKSEMDWVVKRSGADHSNMSEACVKLRGLPFGCSKEEIAQFFTGFEIVPNGIMLPEDRQGRSTGEAFVQFASQDIAEKALGKHKDRIGHRYIEIFKSSLSEANAVTGRDRGGFQRGMGRPGPYDRNDRFGGGPMGPGMGPMGMGGYNRGRGGRNVKGFFDDDFEDYNNGGGYGGFGGRGGRGGMRGGRYGGGGMDDQRNGPPGSQYTSKTGHSVHMRGLPFQAQEQDVFEFFSPIQPVRVNFDFGANGRPSGEANVDFATHQEAMEGMKKHKTNMQHRYIELFLNSTPSSRNSSDGGGYGNVDMGSGFGSGNMGGMGNNMGGMGGGNMGGGGGYGNNGGFGNGANTMGSGYSSMGGGMAMGNMGGGSSMGGGMSGGGMGGGGYSNQGGQFDNQSYNNSNMGSSSSYSSMGAGNQSSGYGNQGMNNTYMGNSGGGGGGYSNMGSSAMNNLSNPNYTAF